jgi:hypothetical protein
MTSQIQPGARTPETLIVNISPPKCGTTGLYGCLTRCADVASPSIKEARFFIDDESERYPDLPPALHFVGNWKFGPSWFWSLFERDHLASRANALDFTTYYSLSDGAPANVRAVFPVVRAIFVVREPVERFVSHYWQYRKMGIELPPISDVIRGGDDLSRFFFDFADYDATWRRWASRVGREAIYVIDFARLKDRGFVTGEVRARLGLHDFEYAPTRSEENRAGLPRIASLQGAMFSKAATAIANLVPPALKPPLLRLRRQLLSLNIREQQYPSLAAADRELLSERLTPARAFYDAHRDARPTP